MKMPVNKKYILKKTTFLLIGFVVSIVTNAQIITTVVGSNTLGYSGDGGAATSAKINEPCNAAFDVSGNLYIADYQNNRIRKIDPSGIISTFAGTGAYASSGDGGLAINAQLWLPWGIAVDASGNVYVSEVNGHKIRKINTVGIISTFAGTGIGGFSGNGGPAVNAQLHSPQGITFDALGNLYIADETNEQIRKITTTGIISTFAGTGAWGYSGDGGLATNAQLYGPTAIDFDAFGNAYIADYGNNRVRKVNTSGIISTFAGMGFPQGYSGDGGPAINAKLDYPYGIAVDALGNVFISDFFNHRIRKVNPAGIISTVVGTGISGYGGDGGLPINAQLEYPMGLVFDASGNLFICDYGANRIRKITCAQPMVTATSPSATCSGNMGCLSASGASTYQWVGPCGFISNQQSPCFPFYTFCSCNYTVTGMDVNGCKNTATVCVNVNALPTLTATTSDSLLCIGQSATLTVSGANTFTWSTGSSAANIVVSPTTTTNYIVNGTDANGCSNNALIIQSVSLCTGITPLSLLEGVRLYPNPNNGSFSVELNSDSQIVITNILGEQILKETIQSGKQSIDFRNQPNGVYFVKVNQQVFKVIKE